MLTHIAEPSFLFPLIRAAVLTDVVFAVLALSFSIDEKCERGAATHATTLIKYLVLRKDATLVTLFIKLLFHFTGIPKKEERNENVIKITLSLKGSVILLPGHISTK